MLRQVVFAILISISFTFFSTRATAQNFEIGLTLGATTYDGDIGLTTKSLGKSLRPAIGLVGKYRLSNSFLLRGHVITGKLAGSEKNHPDAWRQLRGFAFESKITELALVLEWEFFTKGRFTAFAFGGVGATFFNPKADYNEPNPYILMDINNDSKANYKKMTPSIPMGLGVKYAMNHNFNLSLEAGYRKVFTDYLDGISKLANPNRNDIYLITALTLTKEFGGGKRAANRLFKQGDSGCPKF